MNTNVQIRMPHPVSNIARIAFSMFIHIADMDKSITTQEVRRFQALLRDTAWIDNDDLRDALHELHQNYSTVWANYEDGVFAVDVAAISECMSRAIIELGDERGLALRRALARFLERLDGGTHGVKLAGNGDHKARQQARKDIAAVLLRPDVPPASAGALPAPVALPVSTPVAIPVPAPVPLQAPLPSAGSGGPAAFAAPPPTPVVQVRAAPIWPAAALSPRETPVWNGGKTKVRCVSVVWETDDTKTYSFVAEPRMLFHYKPGQFLTLEVPLAGSVLRRSYTISSSPSRPYTLSITVKKVPMGWMSNWLFDNMVEGFECSVTGPAGRFTCHDHPSKKMLFLAAGSGITPTMSMLRWLADTASDADIAFINNVRTADDIIYHQELLHMSTRMGGRMRLAIVPAVVSPARPWHGPTGKLNELLVRAYAPDFAERETFVCGPPGYMAMAKSLLAGMGLRMDRYHDESFGASAVAVPVPAAIPAAAPVAGAARQAAPLQTAGQSVEARTAPPAKTAPPAPPLRSELPTGTQLSDQLAAQPALRPALAPAGRTTAPPPSVPRPATAAPAPAPAVASVPVRTVPEPKEARVTLQGSTDSFVVQPKQTILDAADLAGVNIPHSCRSGICGACKMHKVAGRVDMEEQSVLSQAEIEAGYVLTCVGKAIGPVTLAP